MAEFPLLPIPAPQADRRPPGPRGASAPRTPSVQRQGERFRPVFESLRDIVDSDDPLAVSRDPAGIAPERALVLEVAGSVDGFHRAVDRVPGLEFLGDEEIEFDADADFAMPDTRKGREGQYREDRPVGGRLYLAMPDEQALRQLLSLWGRFQAGQSPDPGFGPWFSVFRQLHELRAWGPLDRLPEETISYLREALETRPDEPVRLEVELWCYRSEQRTRRAATLFEKAVRAADGKIIDQASIPEIAYKAALIDIPAVEIQRLIEREEVQLAVCDGIMLLRPQSTAAFPTAVEALDDGGPVEPLPPEVEPPIAALLDGVPVQRHRLLDSRMVFDDPDGLDSDSVVSERRHGTEMASLILHGDRNAGEPTLPRPIYVRPVLYAPGAGADERPPPNRLLIDTIYRAVLRMKVGEGAEDPIAPDVFIVNLSLGDVNRPFTGPMSPWGRLLDHLAEKYGILFVVSAGNVNDPLPVPAFSGMTDLDEATASQRESAVLKALGDQRSQRTLLSPAEALNVVTVGAWFEDGRQGATPPNTLYAPYESSPGPNLTSAMGLGHRRVVKPDIFMPGGRELFRVVGAGGSTGLRVRAVAPGRFYGLKAAIPDAGGRLDQEGLTSGTSGAAALATRAAHRLFDALTDEANGALLAGVDPTYYGVIVKALLVHRAGWGDKGSLLESIYGPQGRGTHVARRDNIARVLGYGRPVVEEAMTCASNRATLVGYGETKADESALLYRIPLPPSLERVTEPRAVTLTLAWFSPINVHHRTYRRAKLEIQAGGFPQNFGVERAKSQPSDKSVPRGSLFHVRYEGKAAVAFVDDGHLQFRVFCREQGGALDQSIGFGLAVTIEAGEGVPVYQEVRQRLGVRPQPAPGVR